MLIQKVYYRQSVNKKLGMVWEEERKKRKIKRLSIFLLGKDRDEKGRK